MNEPYVRTRQQCERLLEKRADDADVVSLASGLLVALDQLDSLALEIAERESGISELADRLEFERGWYRQLYENAPDPYIVTDTGGTIRQHNQAAAELLVARVGSPLVLAVASGERRRFQRFLDRQAATGGRATFAFGSGDDPRHFDVETRALPPDRLLWLLRDITAVVHARRQLREAVERDRIAVKELRELEEARSSFLLAVSHDLRAPMATVAGLADLLAQDRLSPDERAKVIRQIQASAREVLDLFGDLMDLQRLESRELAVRRQATDLGELVARAVEHVDVGDRIVETGCSERDAHVDPLLVGRIVENLVNNAARHTPRTAKIWVRCHRDPDGLVLVVEDDGPGVPAAMRRSVFELFRRDRRGQGGGLGVGLTLVRRFAEMHGGYARVGDRPGGGASFQVLLPEEREKSSS